MTWLEFIAITFTAGCATLCVCVWAAAFTASRARNIEGSQHIVELQLEASKAQIQGQLELIREEAIREAARRDNQ